MIASSWVSNHSFLTVSGEPTLPHSLIKDLSVHTLKNWMKSTASTATPHDNPAKRPQDWRPEERLLALHESHGLTGEELNAWCRQRGLFAHQLVQWRSDFCSAAQPRSGGDANQTLRALKAENQRLEHELNRKDKTLAEAAALLILQKRCGRCWRARSNDHPSAAPNAG